MNNNLKLTKASFVRQYPTLSAEEIQQKAAETNCFSLTIKEIQACRRKDAMRAQKHAAANKDPIDILLENAQDVGALDNKINDIQDQIELVLHAREAACKPFEKQLIDLRAKQTLVKRLKDLALGAKRL